MGIRRLTNGCKWLGAGATLWEWLGPFANGYIGSHRVATGCKCGKLLQMVATDCEKAILWLGRVGRVAMARMVANGRNGVVYCEVAEGFKRVASACIRPRGGVDDCAF